MVTRRALLVGAAAVLAGCGDMGRFQRPPVRRQNVATMAAANLTPDIKSFDELLAAITLHCSMTTDATTGIKSGGVVARLVQSIMVDQTISLLGGANGANGFVLIGSPWARIIVTDAITDLFAIQASGVQLRNVVVALGDNGSMTRFVHTTLRGGETVIDGCDSPAGVFFLAGAGTAGACSIRNNHTRTGTISTVATSGNNVIMGNFETSAGATITPDATDQVGLNT